MDTKHMTSTPTTTRRWSGWKHNIALKLRFPEPLAFAIANVNLDIHYIEKLVARGCPPHLTVEIVGP